MLSLTTVLTPVALLTVGALPAAAANINNTSPNTTGIVLSNGDTLTNSSTITDSTGAKDPAVRSTGPADIASIVNNGTIKGDGNSAIAIGGDGIGGSGFIDADADLLSFTNNGTVTAGSTSWASALKVGGDIGTFVNSGKMSADRFNTIFIYGNTGTFRNEASGRITGDADTTVTLGGTVGEFVNNGKITQTSTFDDEAVWARNLVTKFSNGGTISGKLIAVRLAGGVGAATNTGTISAAMSNGTAFNVWTQSGSFINEGTIEGQFGLYFQDSATAATVTNRGTIRGGAGGAAITLTNSNDSLTLVTGSTTEGVVDGRGGTDTLKLAGSGSGVFAIDQLGDTGNFRHLELFEKTGSGTWRFTGDNAAALAWTVAAGRVRVDGDIRNTWFELNGGTLSGNGRVGTVDVNAGAKVAPGNSVGTLTTGDLTFAAGSVYEVEIEGGAADLIEVMGTAILDGATVNLKGGSAGCSAATYEILTATNPITTAFAGLTGTAGATLSYGSNSVSIDFAGSGGRTFTGFTDTHNQAAVAAALDAMGCNGQPYAAQLNALTDAQVPAAMDALSGEGHASIAAALLENSNHVAGAIGDRLEQAFSSVEGVEPNGFAGGPTLLDPGVIDGLSIWGQSYGGLTARSGDGNASPTQSSAMGLVFGADGRVSEDWRLGLMGGFGVTAIDAGRTRGTSADATVGAYAGGQIGIVEVKAGAAYTRHFIETSRSIVFPGVDDTMRASYQAGTAQAFLEVSTDVEAGPVTLTPFARIAGVNHATDAFTETGGEGRLRTRASVANALFVTLGLGAEHQFVLNDTMLVTARGSIGWRHAFADQVRVSNSFVGGGPFTVASAGIAPDVAVVSAGVSIDVSQNVSLDLGYEGELAGGLSS
ncbi:MAG: autotransporter domain-containing protein, partial [Burkholderiales bacterium]|nr:autotransporter domain-containing protein [Burkholderiales bacterium]